MYNININRQIISLIKIYLYTNIMKKFIYTFVFAAIVSISFLGNKSFAGYWPAASDPYSPNYGQYGGGIIGQILIPSLYGTGNLVRTTFEGLNAVEQAGWNLGSNALGGGNVFPQYRSNYYNAYNNYDAQFGGYGNNYPQYGYNNYGYNYNNGYNYGGYGYNNNSYYNDYSNYNYCSISIYYSC